MSMNGTLEAPPIDISCIVPVFNEAHGLRSLHERLVRVMQERGGSWEVIYVDDGSTDGSPKLLDELAGQYPGTRVVTLIRNFGQTAALAAGIDESRGDIVVTLDADGQNPPEEIPKVLDKMAEGFDLVSGWRTNRMDTFDRTALSRIANALIRAVTGVPLHDLGCALKAYRRVFLLDIELYGELHRFLPALCAWAGARVGEVEVAHDARRSGKSHYGHGRIIKVMIDLMTIKLLTDFSAKPAYVFGFGGFITLTFSGLLGVFAVFRTLFFGGIWMSPVTIIAIVFFALSFQFFMLGFIAEMLARTYYTTRKKRIYARK